MSEPLSENKIEESKKNPFETSTASSSPSQGIYIKTFGCQMNVYDSHRMESLLQNKGFHLENDLRKAEVVIINTCSIRDKSEQKVLSLLGELRPLKLKSPQKILGISGCVGQRMGRTLLQKVPHLDLVFGPDQIDKVPDFIEEIRTQNKRIVETRLEEEGRQYSQPLLFSSARPSEFMTIMKGCDHFCTYCIVPFVRGREKSRAIPEILHDVQNLVNQGTKEITFLGQNINTYGKGTPDDLPLLIEATAQIEGLERIRYVTSHPRDLTDRMIAQFGEVQKLCPALHLPFQSGSNAVLKKMSRLYTKEQYLEKIKALRKVCPHIALSTDVIVGFPGETEEDFQDTEKMLHEVGFSGAFLFKYSPRPGTRAFSFDPSLNVPEPVKEERLKRAQNIAFPWIEKENQTWVGRDTSVLVESLDKKKRFYSGRNPQNKIVHIVDATSSSVGKIVSVHITNATGSSLRGRLTRQPERN